MARFDGGWVKSWRSIDSSAIGQDGYAKAIFEQLIRWANTKETRLRGNTIKRGEVVTGISEIIAATGFARATIWRKLKLMEELGMVKRSMERKTSVITIVNYDKYQADESFHETVGETLKKQSRNAPETIEKQSRNGRDHHIEEYKNKRTEEHKNSSHKEPRDETPYERVRELWNQHRGNLPELSAIDGTTREKFRVLYAKVPELEKWESIFKKMGASTYLQGKPHLSFDWLVKDAANIRKVRDGYFDDPPKKANILPMRGEWS